MLGNLLGCIATPPQAQGQAAFELKQGEVAQRSCYGRKMGSE